MRIAAELHSQEPVQRRQSSRRPVALRVGFRKRGYDSAKADILDLSTTGFRVDTALALGPGVEVWLKLPGLEPRPAKVVWVRGFEAGCEFLSPLYDAVLDQFLAAISKA